MNQIEQVVEFFRSNTPDINEHLDTLTRLAEECEAVTEFGFRWGASASALIKGKPAKFTTYDLVIPIECRDLINSAKGETWTQFNEASILDVEIEPCDLLFIDTLHTYKQLKQELEKHAEKAKKYLVFHDTHTYRHKGEDGTEKGLYDAIQEYIADHPHWIIHFDHQNNNGLLALRRI